MKEKENTLLITKNNKVFLILFTVEILNRDSETAEKIIGFAYDVR